MDAFKNIAFTGCRQAGKSTAAARLIRQAGWSAAGFCTEVCRRTPAGPLYTLRDLLTGETMPISHLTDNGICGIPDTFEDLGVRCLKNSLGSDAQVLLLDEIGRFERNCSGFLRWITCALDGEKPVIAVLKKEELPHISAILRRPDTLVVDLDEWGRARAHQISDQWQAAFEKTDGIAFDICNVSK